MAYFNDKFKKARLDQSPYLFHFINGKDKDPHSTLKKILNEQQLISSGSSNCFSSSPLTAITKFFEVKTNKTGCPLYWPYGIGFSRDILVRNFNARNVIYVDGKEFDDMPEALKWRTDLLNVDSYDFEYLREWRIKGKVFDFKEFPKSEIIVVAPDKNSLDDLTVNYDLVFNPVVNYLSGDIDEDWDEQFTRGWKGIAVNSIGVDYLDDYAISASTVSQVLGEDMLEKLFGSSPILVSNSSN